MGCWIQPANVNGQEKSGYVMGENKLSLDSATEYVDSGNSNNSNPYIGNLVDSTWSPVVLI